MRYLTLAEVLDLHRRIIEQSGGAGGVRELGGVLNDILDGQSRAGRGTEGVT